MATVTATTDTSKFTSLKAPWNSACWTHHIVTTRGFSRQQCTRWAFLHKSQ